MTAGSTAVIPNVRKDTLREAVPENVEKGEIVSTHVHVSSKYMDRCLNEFTFRLNHREMGNAMFDLLIASV